MTFHNHSIERLKELGRKLPKEISKSHQKNKRKTEEVNYPNLHPVEIETNPEQLFRELMEISEDGSVPPHLLERLKELESNAYKDFLNTETVINDDSQDSNSDESLNLYTQFKQYLLEDDID